MKCERSAVRTPRADLLVRTLFVVLGGIGQPAWGQQNPGDLTSRSLEDLMNVEVTSVSKKEQKLSRTAAAVFVITQEDIQRSGATNIPDLLRMVPGMDVAQISANTWAISARGLNGQFSNELLVTLDGRNVYTPTFGGVYWDAFDVPLENIEKIEVIRGPGGSVWGANAVNGVVNIITKKAGETQGAMIVAGGGNHDQGFGTVQYGGHAGKTADYRIYSKYFNDGQWPGVNGQAGGDGWHVLRGGFRSDSTISEKDSLAVSGGLYSAREAGRSALLPAITSPRLVNTQLYVNFSGGFLLSTWEHRYSDCTDSKLLVSYDAYSRNEILKESRKTLSVDFQNHVAWGERQDLVWGLVYRFSDADTSGSLTASFSPPNINTNLVGAFLQDEIALIRERLYLTVGTKLEHNYYSGFGVMPSARVAYEISERQMLWAAVSRALRTPAETDAAIRTNFAGLTQADGTLAVLALVGNPHFRDEVVTAYELGYRQSFGGRVSLDLAAFYNDYDYQQTTEPAVPFFEATPVPPHLVLPITYQNLMHGEEHGVELSANWKVTQHWKISPGYDFARFHFRTDASSQDTSTAPNTEGSDPHVQAQIRSHLDLSRNVGWDTSAYFVDRLLFHAVPSYTRLDTGLSWRCTDNLALSIFGQNLLRDHHLEFIDDNGATHSTLVKRSAYAKLTWRF